MDSKYEALYDHLSKIGHDVTLSFREVADIIGEDDLADSAYAHDAWWSTDDSTHTQSHAWTDTGFKADVDRDCHLVTAR